MKPDWIQHLIATCLLAMVTFVIYANSFDGVFVFDDEVFITDVGYIQADAPPSLLTSAEQRPLLRLTFWWNYQIGELDPWSYHLFNVLIHACATILLYFLVHGTLGLPAFEGRKLAQDASVVAFASALVFCTHPLQTQSVTYVVQRGESLASLFYLLTLWSVLKAETKGWRIPFSVLAVISLLLGAASKQIVITAPVVALLYQLTFLRKKPRELLFASGWVYAGFALISLWLLADVIPSVTSASTQESETAVEAEVDRGRRASGPSAGFAMKGLSSWEYLRTQPQVIAHYVRLFAWPHPLCLDYSWPVENDPFTIQISMLLSVIMIGGIAMLWYYRPTLGFLPAAFGLILAPTSSFLPIQDLAFEHRMYLPLASLAILSILAVRSLLVHVIKRNHNVLLLILVGLWATILSGLTITRNEDYSSVERLWRQTLQVVPHSFRVWHNLGTEYRETERYDLAIEAYQRSIEIKPAQPRTHNDLGLAYQAIKQNELAAEHYRLALRYDPNLKEAWLNVGNLVAKTNAEASIPFFEKALAIDPNYEEALNNLRYVREFLARE